MFLYCAILFLLSSFVSVWCSVYVIEHMGCFTDKAPPNRALTGATFIDSNTLTNDLCSSACAADSYTFSGTEAAGREADYKTHNYKWDFVSNAC